jgi:hypothetical protein
MQFWMSGRIDSDIRDEMFRPVLLEIRNKLNDRIKEVDLGNQIKSYDVIFNIFKGENTQKCLYKVSTQETDIDIAVDHDKYLYANFNERAILFLEGILWSVEQLKRHKKLKAFDMATLHETVLALSKEYLE